MTAQAKHPRDRWWNRLLEAVVCRAFGHSTLWARRPYSNAPFAHQWSGKCLRCEQRFGR